MKAMSQPSAMRSHKPKSIAGKSSWSKGGSGSASIRISAVDAQTRHDHSIDSRMNSSPSSTTSSSSP